MLPKTSPYLKTCNGKTKWICFAIKDNFFLAKYNTIWDKFSANMKKELDSETVYKKKFL